ncbi:hypothetical protein DE146DRAFT_777899 [Phaeosphaeria sp. MPI-PUGE-AT-0046c]|nr:hypothetical protein DE146DRAFT_777899 [Phaeosphaeria sp. MPI-PUGE-AT-0046c]
MRFTLALLSLLGSASAIFPICLSPLYDGCFFLFCCSPASTPIVLPSSTIVPGPTSEPILPGPTSEPILPGPTSEPTAEPSPNPPSSSVCPSEVQNYFMMIRECTNASIFDSTGVYGGL